MIQLLLDREANIEATSESGQTPLFKAASEGHEAIVRLLLDWKANIEATNESGQTPLIEAVL